MIRRRIWYDVHPEGISYTLINYTSQTHAKEQKMKIDKQTSLNMTAQYLLNIGATRLTTGGFTLSRVVHARRVWDYRS
jgi:hypothetical protein